MQMGAVVTSVLATDTANLRRALEDDAEAIDVRLRVPRDTARLMLQLIEAQKKGGAVVVPVQSEFTPNEAATILGISRPQVYKLIDQGRLACRMVGTHRRIPAASVTAFRTEQHAAQREAMAELTRLSNELGLIE